MGNQATAKDNTEILVSKINEIHASFSVCSLFFS